MQYEIFNSDDYSESVNREYPCVFTDSYHPLRFTDKHFCTLAYRS